MMYDFYKDCEDNLTLEIHLLSSLSLSRIFTNVQIIFNAFLLNGNVIIFVIFLFTQQQLLLLPVYIPFINHETILGYLLNIGLQILMGFIGFFTFTSYDTAIILYGYHGILMSKVFEIEMKELQHDCDEFRDKFTKVVKLHENYKNFIDEFARLVKLPFFVAILMNTIGLMLCIWVANKESFALGVGGSLGLFAGYLLPFVIAIMISRQVRLQL